MHLASKQRREMRVCISAMSACCGILRVREPLLLLQGFSQSGKPQPESVPLTPADARSSFRELLRVSQILHSHTAPSDGS